MPWKAKKTKSGAVVKDKNNKTVSTHTSMKKAKSSVKARYANYKKWQNKKLSLINSKSISI